MKYFINFEKDMERIEVGVIITSLILEKTKIT